MTPTEKLVIAIKMAVMLSKKLKYLYSAIFEAISFAKKALRLITLKTE
jgi:hypothetical protein